MSGEIRQAPAGADPRVAVVIGMAESFVGACEALGVTVGVVIKAGGDHVMIPSDPLGLLLTQEALRTIERTLPAAIRGGDLAPGQIGAEWSEMDPGVQWALFGRRADGQVVQACDVVTASCGNWHMQVNSPIPDSELTELDRRRIQQFQADQNRELNGSCGWSHLEDAKLWAVRFARAVGWREAT